MEAGAAIEGIVGNGFDIARHRNTAQQRAGRWVGSARGRQIQLRFGRQEGIRDKGIRDIRYKGLHWRGVWWL